MAGNTWNRYTFLWGLDTDLEGNAANFVWGISASIIEKLKKGGSRGGVRRRQDLWNAWDKLSEKNKKKIISVVIFLETGEVKATTNEIAEYNITVDDIEYLIEQYDLWKETKEKLLNISVDAEEPTYNVKNVSVIVEEQ